METKATQLADATMVKRLAALAHDHRLAIFRVLVRAGAGGLPAGAISDKLDLAPSSLSFHIANLRNAGLVSDERDGRSIIYRADFGAMAGLVAYLHENCCADDPLGTCAPE
ncbi:ArsR/SmtB family transcription factor [Qipengyuania flava]|uniref:ArsR/SmtB family transcription factor n=1 Tax=Qipengyuania flava TaxID=192812 RepID=UPI001C6367B9|nr:metalloregulator ArsR/SmtB family transcription factor [Qipengyuania flava]QYJ06751.1 metalloregulator ArsR/SmtB family transcription factor [Qipengyuania flava]